MAKWAVFVQATVSRYLGEVEADSKDEAIEKGWDMDNCDLPNLCYACSSNMEMGDIDVDAEKCDDGDKP